MVDRGGGRVFFWGGEEGFLGGGGRVFVPENPEGKTVVLEELSFV